MKQSLGEFISTLRKANGYTQADVAEKLNVSNRTLSSWETDRTAPDVSLLPALADLYGVTVDEILRCARAPKDESEKRFSPDTENTMRKNRYSKFCGKRILCLGLGLLGAALFVTGCGLVYANNCPLWLDVLLMVIGAGGNAACLILLSFFYYSALRQEGLVFKSDYTVEKQSYALTLRHGFAITLILNSLPYIACSIIILFLYFALNLNDVYVSVGDIYIVIDYTVPTVTVVILSLLIGLSTLIFSIVYNAAGLNKFGSSKQKEATSFNRKIARRIFGIGAIPLCVLIIAAVIVIIVPVHIENVEYRSKDYDEFIAHMHTLTIDENNDRGGNIPHGSYVLEFPTNLTLNENVSIEFNLGNGFCGIYYKTTYWTDNDSFTVLEWRVDYGDSYMFYTPTLKCEIDGKTQYFAALPYKDRPREQFNLNGSENAYFEIRCNDGYEIVHVTNLNEVKTTARILPFGAAFTYLTVCSPIYLFKRKNLDYGF